MNYPEYRAFIKKLVAHLETASGWKVEISEGFSGPNDNQLTLFFRNSSLHGQQIYTKVAIIDVDTEKIEVTFFPCPTVQMESLLSHLARFNPNA